MIDRVIWIVLDSVGMGELPDAAAYGDVGSNTIGNIAKKVGGLALPNLTRLGLGNIEGMEQLSKDASAARTAKPEGIFARLSELSNGKDTITGHWEMAGIFTERPFPTYPNGFPPEVIGAFEKAVGVGTLGNKTASGTEILDELGEEHMKTKKLIVYTSADSVFQIAAHEELYPIPKLYEICETARRLLDGQHTVARVIARPFIGSPGAFTRTANRHDYAIAPPYDTVLDTVAKNGLAVMAVGKIVDIFNGRGVTESVHTKSNDDGIDKTLGYMQNGKTGLIFTNLVDFDMKWGHRNDYAAYAKGLEAFDARLPEILSAMTERDVLFLTADHGCDPTFPGTDHTREYVPLVGYGAGFTPGVDLGTRKSFADIGQTIAEILSCEPIRYGESFLSLIRRK
ncbi:MAG: phosphopentomutase [Spirochaetota bacterium]|jgi:phosphopentomutase|nr:phosphopentomutase [Spirochaetota bacterium]